MTRPEEVRRGLGVFPYRGLTLVDGQGCRVEDEEGNVYLDAGGASYGTGNVGHGNPRVVDALQEASEGLLHTSQVFANPQRSRLVDKLASLAGSWAGRVFLSNSGTEAVEAAIKSAVVQTGGSRLVAFEGGFHGRTLGSLSATHKPAYREPFQERLGETTFVPYGEVDALEEALGEDVAAVLVEPVQGEAGVRVPPDGFLKDVVAAARDAGAWSIVDEVQTGLGRTGHDLAVHGAGVEPDCVCLAKSLAAGLPLGATVFHRQRRGLEKGLHGSTFGGSPAACRVASAVLEVLEGASLSRRARERGRDLVDALEGLEDPLVHEVRGRGLMIGVELAVAPTPVLKALQAEGVLALPGGEDAVRLLPPLVLSREEADRIVETFSTALERVRRSKHAPAEEAPR